MAIDSRIPLMTQTPNSFGTMVQALSSGEQLQQMPYRNAMLEAGARMRSAQADAYESSAARQNELQDRERARLRNLFTLNSLQQIRGASPGSRGVLVESLEAQGKSQGLLPPDFDLSEFNFEDDAWLDQNIQIARSAEEAYRSGAGGQTADSANFEARMRAAGIQPGTPDYRRAARIDAGLDPRAVGSASQTIANTPGQTAVVGASEGSIARDKGYGSEFGKLLADAELRPDVEASVRDAVLAAEDAHAVQQKDRDNQRALAVYDAAMSGLVTGLGGTTTGPGVGWMPALTADAQIAEGAVAATAPVLKQLFRTAGEGNFTDSDQKILMDMVPTRKDLPEARTQKFKTIDAIVRAKLLGEEPEIVRNPTREQYDALPSGAIYIWNWEAKRKP